MASRPAYTRLTVDQRRRELIDAGSALFAQHTFEEISMREIAQAAGVSKALLYHYFPSKTELFTAAIEEYTAELARTIEPDGSGTPLEQLGRSLDRYLRWIELNAATWTKLMQSANSLPEAHRTAQSFRARTLHSLLGHLSPNTDPPALLRNTLQGWLGYVDAAILDWVEHDDFARDQLRDTLLNAFAASLIAAQQPDPRNAP